MNPLNRKMFRQPGMSRQPTGILASSPQLANVVRQRMGQPVQMAHGGYHPPRSPMGRVSTSRRPVPGSVRIPLIDLLPKSGFARPALDDFLASSGAARASAPGVVIQSGGLGSLSSPPVMSARGSGPSRPAGATNVTSVNIPQSGMGSIASRPVMSVRGTGSSVDASPLIDQGIAAAKSAVSGDYMRPLTDAIVRGVRSDIDALPEAKGPASPPPALVAGQRGNLAMGMIDDPTLRPQGDFIDTNIQDFEIRASSLPDDDMTAAEELAASATETSPKATTGDGTTEPEKKPNVNRNKLNDLLTQVQGNANADEVSKTTPKLNADEAATPEAAEALKLTLPEESSLSDMEAMAKKIMGFDPSKSKEAKRDSFWRNLTMAGLAIAAGESGNALTNVAKGLMVGMDSYGKDIKDINAQEAEERKEYRATLRDLIKTDKDSAIAMATLKNNHAYRVADLNQKRDQFESTQAFQREKLKLDNSLANKQLEVQIISSLAGLDLKQETLDETKRQNVIVNSQNALKIMPEFQQAAVGIGYLVLDDESGEYEWTDEGQAWIDRNSNAILAASVTGSTKSGPKAPDRDRYILDALGDTEQLDTARDALKAAGIDDPTDRQLEAYFGSQYDRVAGGVTAAPTTATGGNIPSFDSEPNTQTLEALSKSGVTQINVGGQLFNITSQ
jgi:hypothetical protein